MHVLVTDALDRLDGALRDLEAVNWQASDPGAVARAAVETAKGADQLQAISLLAFAQHEANGGVRNDGDASGGDWSSRQTKSSKDTGRRQAARAKRLSRAKKVGKAAAEGRLSSEQADKLAGARNEDNAELFDELEDELITKAQGSYDDAERVAREFREATGETPRTTSRPVVAAAVGGVLGRRRRDGAGASVPPR